MFHAFLLGWIKAKLIQNHWVIFKIFCVVGFSHRIIDPKTSARSPFMDQVLSNGPKLFNSLEILNAQANRVCSFRLLDKKIYYIYILYILVRLCSLSSPSRRDVF